MKTIQIALAIIIGFSSQVLTAQKLTVNNESSSIEWIGKKVGGQHDGHIQIKSGYLDLIEGNITGGEFVIDMNSITVSDIKNKALNGKLVKHLESDDFFHVEKYSSAKLIITKSTDFKNGEAMLTGDITIRGKTETITFKTIKNGNNYATTLELDRAKFNSQYKSKSFFDDLGDKTINDIFTLNIKLVLN